MSITTSVCSGRAFSRTSPGCTLIELAAQSPPTCVACAVRRIRVEKLLDRRWAKREPSEPTHQHAPRSWHLLPHQASADHGPDARTASDCWPINGDESELASAGNNGSVARNRKMIGHSIRRAGHALNFTRSVKSLRPGGLTGQSGRGQDKPRPSVSCSEVQASTRGSFLKRWILPESWKEDQRRAYAGIPERLRKDVDAATFHGLEGFVKGPEAGELPARPPVRCVQIGTVESEAGTPVVTLFAFFANAGAAALTETSDSIVLLCLHAIVGPHRSSAPPDAAWEYALARFRAGGW